MILGNLPSRVGIVGLGLIGGSLARDLIARGVRVTAYDRDPSSVDYPPDTGPGQLRLVDSLATVMDAPVVVIAVPVGAALDVLTELSPLVTSAHLVLDTGSTKQPIVARASELGIGPRFVGCHPLTGDHRTGWAASRPGLFEGAPLFICPGSETDPTATDGAEMFWQALGGIVQWLSPEAHDQRMAFVSHLPHLLSVSLALTLQHEGLAHENLGPGGRDMARLAGGSPQMWSDIVAQNRPAITVALAQFERRLGELRRAIDSGKNDDVQTMLTSGRAWHAG